MAERTGWVRCTGRLAPEMAGSVSILGCFGVNCVVFIVLHSWCFALNRAECVSTTVSVVLVIFLIWRHFVLLFVEVTDSGKSLAFATLARSPDTVNSCLVAS